MRALLFILKCLVGFFASLGVLLVAALVAGFFLWRHVEGVADFEPGVPAVPERTLITLDLGDGLIEALPADPLGRLSLGRSLTLADLRPALEAAAADERVRGLFAHLGAGDPGLARIQELRDAIAAFRAAGKPAVAFAETFGEAGDAMLHYYLASAFDQVWIQPSGEVAATGFRLETPFLRQALDKVGIEPQLDQREEYKGVMNLFTDSAQPAPQRQNLQQLVDSWLDQAVNGIAEGRGLAPAAVRTLIDEAPHRAGPAREAGLVDRLGYLAEAKAAAAEAAGGEVESLALRAYARATAPSPDDSAVIALVHGLGPVMLARAGAEGPVSDESFDATRVARAIGEASEDPEVEAIVLRIDSPGGSYVASDAVWHAVTAATAKGLPVIASMGNVAASGGYFVAAPATRIVAQPGTLTGSIGVVGGKFVLSGLWEKLGVNWDGVAAGANADMTSFNRPFSEADWQRLQSSLDAIYQDFTDKVAAGRALEREAVLAAAKGQVWSGADAKDLGLVDELGGLYEAREIARAEAGIAPDRPLRFKPFPERAHPLEELLEQALGEVGLLSRLARQAAAMTRAVEILEPALGGLTPTDRAPRLRYREP